MVSQNVKKWAISLSVLSVPLGFALSVDALPREPDYFCYELVPTVGVVNLNGMCAQNPAAGTVGATGATTGVTGGSTGATGTDSKKDEVGAAKRVEVKPEARKIFEFSELSYEGNRLIGSVRNKTRENRSDSYVNFKVYRKKDASNSQLVDAGRARVLDSDLPPGKSSPFEASVSASGDRIVITSVN